MNSKAQSSFEMILVTGIMFIFILTAYGNYFSTAESFNVSAQAKLAAVEVLDKYTTGAVTIKRIELTEDKGEYSFNIVTEPIVLPLKPGAEINLENEIKEKITLGKVKEITINGE